MYYKLQEAMGLVTSGIVATGLVGVVLGNPINAQAQNLERQDQPVIIAQQGINLVRQYINLLEECRKKYPNGKGTLKDNFFIDKDGSIMLTELDITYNGFNFHEGEAFFTVDKTDKEKLTHTKEIYRFSLEGEVNGYFIETFERHSGILTTICRTNCKDQKPYAEITGPFETQFRIFLRGIRREL